MGVGASDRDAEQPAGQHVGRRRAAADVGRAAGRQAAVDPLGPAQAELQHRLARGRQATRAALVAMSVWKLTMFSSAVSSSWAWMSGPVTRTSGSWGKTTVPSGMASTSHASCIRAR